jgi:DNA repair exonuclease SbcCD ATPase subunit
MKVYIKNFRCFKEKAIQFPDGNISLLKGESGKGKSTILQSCLWCLFGNLRNIYPLDFKPSSTNQTIVTLEFPKSKLRYITRSQPPEQIKVYIKKDVSSDNSEEFDVLESEAAQRYIESVFGTKDIWFVSSYLAQGERSPLMTNSNSDKMNLLCEILFGNKFNSDLENYQNPDWYNAKLEKELNEVSSKLAVQTNLYNTSYAKYMEAHNNYKPSNDFSWPHIPSESELSDLLSDISNLRDSITTISKSMLEIKGKEKEKEMLEERYSELQTKVKAFESMNSEDVVAYLQKTREEIKDLESSIQDLNTSYLQTLALEQKQEFLQGKIMSGETKQSEILSQDPSVEFYNLQTIQMNLSDQKENSKTFNNELLSVKVKESEHEKLKKKLEENSKELESIISKLNTFPIQDIDYLYTLIQNTKSFQKLKDIQGREPEDIYLPYNESEILEIQVNLPRYISEYKQNQNICLKNNLITSESEPIDETVELKIKNNLESIKKLLDFVEIMKKELELKEKHTILDDKIEKIKESIQTIKSSIENDEKLIQPESSIPIFNLETYITMKTEIQMNTGDAMQCPDCNSSLEIKHSETGAKLCKLTKIKYSKEESKKRIEVLNKLSSELKILKSKESEVEYLEQQKSELEIPKPEYTSEQVIARYTPEFIVKYKTFYEEVSKFKFGVKNEYSIAYTDAIEVLQKIPKVQKRKAWEKEFAQAKENLSIDSSLEILSEVQIKIYENNRLEIPILQSKKNSLESSVKDLEKSLETISDFLTVHKSSFELSEIIVKIGKEIEDLEKQQKNKIFYDEVYTALEKLKKELSAIHIPIPSSEIKDKIESLRVQVNALKETLSGYSQLEILTSELNSIEVKLKNLNEAIQQNTSSEKLSLNLDSITETIKNKEVYHKLGMQLKEMYEIRAILEQAQKEALKLATEQSQLNRLKILITEVTNSSLQNLVDSINTCTNNILEDLFENDIKVELKLFKEHKKTNGLKPQINFNIFYNNNVYDNIMGLSGGEKDRISLALTIALACVNPSPVLFLDECLSTVGNDLRECAIDALKKFVISQTGKTCILVQHSMIEGHCDAVIEI